jgi:hypothetical protein
MSKLAPPNVTVTRITRSGPARALDDCTGYEGQHTTFATTKALCCQTLRARNDPVASSEIGAGGRIRLVYVLAVGTSQGQGATALPAALHLIPPHYFFIFS